MYIIGYIFLGIIVILLIAILLTLVLICGKISGWQADCDPDEKIKQEIFDSLSRIKTQLEKTI